jgi:ABC-2 type transport system permease protein
MGAYLRTIWVLCLTLSKRFVRDPVALFFTFLFPVLFLLVFGALFRSSDLSFDVVVLSQAKSSFAEQFVKQVGSDKVFKVKKDIKTFDLAKEKMGRGEVDSIIELPADFGQPDAQGVPRGRVVVYYETSNPQTGQTVAGVMQQVLDGINKKLGVKADPLTVEQKTTKTSNLKRFDYTFAGLVGFSIMGLAIFGLANGLPSDKKTGSLRRLRATPLRASQLVLATALEYLFIGMASVLVLFVVAALLFDFQMRGNYLVFTLFTLLGVFCMFGFGLAIGGWAKNEQQSAPLSNLVSLPLMFLSGVFFPTFLMPDWLERVAGYLPLTPIVDGIRLITTEGATFLTLGPQLAIIGAWTVLIYFIAARVFRWE